MNKVEFVRIERKVNYENEEAINKSYYLHEEPETDQTGKFKDKLYLVVADVFGIPHVFEIGKIVNKYTSGKKFSPRMIDTLSEYLATKEFSLNSEGAIEDLDKILKKAIAANGFS